MHPTILVQRKAQAINRILERAAALIKRIDLDPTLLDALQPKGVKDPQILEMFRLEALANLFDELAISAGITEPVTVVTPEDKTEPAADEEAVTPIPIEIGPDGLPAPTLDEAPTETTEESPVEQPVEEEALAEATEELPAKPIEILEEEEQPAEQPVEVPAEAPKKTTRKRSKK